MGKGKRNRRRARAGQVRAGAGSAALPPDLADHLAVDRTTLEQFGVEGLRAVWANLWPIDCQTCGRALEPGRPASLYVADAQAFASATVHHLQCRAPEWSQSPSLVGGALLTWQALAFMLPLTNGADELNRPMLLVNPQLEQVQLAPGEDGRWKVSQGLWRRVGLRTPGQDFVCDEPVPHATAQVVRNSVSVRLKDYPNEWNCEIDRQVADSIHELGGITLGITTAMNPGSPTTYHQLGQLMGTGQILMGWIALRGVRDDTPLRETSAPTALTTYVLHWSSEHATVGELLAYITEDLDEQQAIEWAQQHVLLPDASRDDENPLEWRPVSLDPQARWLLDPISLRTYFLRRHGDSWYLVDVFSRHDGRAPGDDEQAMREWGESTIRQRTGTTVLDWSPRPSTGSGFTTLHGVTPSQ